MSARNVAAAGLVLFVLGGPLLVVGLSTGAVAPTVLGVTGLWLGLGLVVVALLQLGRSQHRLLLEQREQIRRLADAAAQRPDDDVPAGLDARLTALEHHVDEQIDRRDRDLLRTVDARILGIHHTVRDLVVDRGGVLPGDPDRPS